MKAWLYILFFITLFSCKSKDDSSVPNEYAAKFISELNPSDTFLYDFAIDKKGRFDSISWRYLKDFERQLGLPSLEKGYDSIQIGVGFSCALDGRSKLVILKNDGRKWIAELSDVYEHYNPAKAEIDSLTRKIVFQNPSSGWVNFINRLFNLKILTITDNNKIPGFKYAMPMDGCGIGIWVATKNVYRFYNYDNPDMYEEKYWQAANVIAIQELLYKEFEILKRWDDEAEKAYKKSVETRLKRINKSKSVKK